MRQCEWNNWTDPETAKRRAGGRKRYNAKRRRKADARREALAELISDFPLGPLVFRGSITSLAGAFGVSPSTISRDLHWILFGGSVVNYYSNGEWVYSVTRGYPGGPILRITDPDGYEIHGKARKRILRNLPRYLHKRKR